MFMMRAAFAATAALAPVPGWAVSTPVARQLTVTAKPFSTVTKSVRVTRDPQQDASAAQSGLALDQFDTSRGILVGAGIDVDIPVAMRVTAAVVGQGGGSIQADYTGHIGIPLATALNASTLTVSRTCSSSNNCNTSPSLSSTRMKGSAQVATSGLAAFAGSQTASVGLEAVGFIKGTKTNPSTSGVLTPKAEITFGTDAAGVTNTVAMTYSYLDFATPSFSGTDPTVTSLALDFGRLTKGDPAKTLTFSLNNIGGASTAGLSLASIATTGSGFTTDLATFTNGLAGGQSGAYSITLDPSRTGDFRESLALTFEDFAPAGAIGGRSYTMFLTARAYVAAVPEPATWGMMLTGFGLVGAAARRRRGGRRVAC